MEDKITKDLSDLYFACLGFLSKHGVTIDADMTDFLYEYYPELKGTDIVIWSKRMEGIIQVLNALITTEYIKPSVGYMTSDMGGYSNKKKEFKASITNKGVDYYYNHILSVETVDSLKRQQTISVITIAISSLAILISVWGLCQKSLTPQITIQKLQLNTQLEQSRQLSHSIHTNHDTIYKKH